MNYFKEKPLCIRNIPVQYVSTFGLDESGLHYIFLMKYERPFPLKGFPFTGCGCGCGYYPKDEKDWEKHLISHRTWHYVSTGKRYEVNTLDRLSALHRHCSCNVLHDTKDLWCPDCGGYITMNMQKNKPWLFERKEL